MNPTQARAHRLLTNDPTNNPARVRLAIARGYDRDDDLAHDLADTIDTRRTISTDDYDDAPAGWTLTADAAYEHAEPDTDGTYSDRPTGPDSIDLRRWGWHEGSHSFRYWTPGAYSLDDYRTDARTFGAARHAAWLYAWRMIEQDERRDRTASNVPVTVTASRDGIDLGSATVGISTSDEDDHRDDYLAEVCAELWPQAIEEAEAAVARLCASRCA